MLRSLARFALFGLITTLFAAPALAQDDPVKGIYAVARAGASISPEQKFDGSSVPLSSLFDDKTKYKTGITGQIGGGYDFGLFRVEQTIGYTSNDLNLKDANTGGLTSAGRSRAFSMTVAGYVDIPVHKTIVPYVGGGIGAARVEANLSRVNSATSVGSSFSGKDWGLMWHADAGIGVRVSRKMTIEVGGRYAQTSGLKYAGESAGVATSFEPKLSTLSATIGVRHVF